MIGQLAGVTTSIHINMYRICIEYSLIKDHTNMGVYKVSYPNVPRYLSVVHSVLQPGWWL